MMNTSDNLIKIFVPFKDLDFFEEINSSTYFMESSLEEAKYIYWNVYPSPLNRDYFLSLLEIKNKKIIFGGFPIIEGNFQEIFQSFKLQGDIKVLFYPFQRWNLRKCEELVKND